jgi:HD-like signal output (HDOD) protein/GGDEF domain-containing protein
MSIAPATETVGLVQQFVERAGQLYSLPAAAAEMLRLTNQPHIDPRAIKECLERDPALAARILRVANSSLFGPSRPITDLGQALALLGVRPLKMLVLGFSLPRELFTGLEAAALGRYWRASLIKAVAARELAEHAWQVPGDEPFLAGLVQDLGVLALVQQLGEPYLKLLDHVQLSGGRLDTVELEMLGLDHFVLSARLLLHWGLPAGLAAAISVPPDERRIYELTKREQALPQMLHLADLVARLLDRPEPETLAELLSVGSRYCGLTSDQLQRVVATLQEKVTSLADVLALELPEGQSYLDILLSAQRCLADEALTFAAELAKPQPEQELLALASRLQAELAVATSRGAGGHPPSALAGATASAHRDEQRPHAATSGHREPSLASLAAAAIQSSRQSRTALSLALFEIDHFGERLLQLGANGMTALIHRLRGELAGWIGQSRPALLVSDSRLALLLPDQPRSEAVQATRTALSAVKAWSLAEFRLPSELTLSCGIATLEVVPANFATTDLVKAAERCLAGAELSGGNTIKSIEL